MAQVVHTKRRNALRGAVLLGALTLATPAAARDIDWTYNGSAAGDRYSSLTQITPQNVTNLKEAWRLPMAAGGLESQPIKIGRMVYVVTTSRTVAALNAATGAPAWTFDPEVKGNQPIRGLAAWRDGAKLRIVFGREHYLYVLDAQTGKPVPNFGEKGRIDIRDNLRRKPEENAIYLTSPVAIYRNLIVVNGRVAENTPASPGDVRAFDARTGKLAWTFHTIPHPGEVGAETWPEGAHLTQGGANAWSGASVDTKRGLVFVNTGSPADDFYGAKRLGDNRFANSTIALDAKTGKRVWDFQQVHHDLWDSDSTSPPLLTTVTRNGKKVDVAVAWNKAAYIYVLDRKTGQSVFPIVDTPVPPSNVPGEVAAKTQPIPSLPRPLTPKAITVDDLNNATPETLAAARALFDGLYGGGKPFVPLALNQNTLVIPGFAGAWGGMAADKAGVIYATAGPGAGMSMMVDNTKAREQIGEPGAPLPAGGLQNGYAHLDYAFKGYGRFTLPSGEPALSPSFVTPTLNAVDLNTGAYRWTIPLPSRSGGSGPLITASGLLFIAAGNKLQAFATTDGAKLWETQLPSSGGNGAATYTIDGKQYVVLSSGGALNPAYVAYALP